MKKLFVLFLISSLSLVSCNKSKADDTQGNVPDLDKSPIIKFEKDTYDFGTIKEGDIVEYRYKFENTGTVPLVISDVQAQCGCTVPTWPHQPVGPGQEDMIVVKFDSKGKAGPQTKWITVYSNSFNGQDRVNFTAEVLKADSTKVK